MNRPIIFVGSRQGMAQLAVVADLSGMQILGILDHHYYGNTDTIADIPVIGDERWLLDPENAQAKSWIEECDFFPANYHNGSMVHQSLDILRSERIDILEQVGANVVNLIHPESKLYGLTNRYSDNSFKFGKGNFIDQGATFHNDQVTIGDYCCFTWGTKISHGANIGNNCIFTPNTFYQECDIGNNVFLGYNSEISPFAKERISIGDQATVWSKASVQKSVPANSIYTNKDRIVSKKALYSTNE